MKCKYITCDQKLAGSQFSLPQLPKSMDKEKLLRQEGWLSPTERASAG